MIAGFPRRTAQGGGVVAALLLLSAPRAFGAGDAGASADSALPPAPPDLALPPDPEAPRVGASLDRTEAHVGDPLTLTLSAIARGKLVETVRLPPKLDLGKFELVDSSSSDRDLGDGNRSRRFVLRIAAYETGDLEVPAIVLAYQNSKGDGRTVETASIPVTVRSLTGEDPAAAIQPEKSPRRSMIEDRRVYAAAAWAGGLVALVLAVLIARALLRRRRLRAVVIPIVPARPAHEVALERIAALRAAGGFDEGGYRPFFFSLAEILRAYLGQRFGFDSLERTTTELCVELGAIADPQLAPLRDRIRAFLESSDLVKFAKAASTDEAARAALDEAEAIVEATVPRAAPGAAVAPADGSVAPSPEPPAAGAGEAPLG